jgi:DNA-binding HxlR family transcriptional regulator
MPRKAQRSGCPVSLSLDVFGDRWSLLIVRDIMVRGYTTFRDFENSGEGIASNILADRLHRLTAAGIITAEAEASDARRVHYRLTEKGIDLAPVLLELLLWGARHEKAGLDCAMIAEIEKNKTALLAEARRRWQERDSTPLLPPPPPTSKRRTHERNSVSELRRPLRRGARVLPQGPRRGGQGRDAL